MKAVTHLEKVITGEVSAVTHLEKVIAEETSAATYTEKVIAGEAPPITHLEKVIAGIASPVTHLEQVWAGRTPEPTEHEYTGAVPVTIIANGQPLLDYLISGNMYQTSGVSPTTPIQPQECGERTKNLFDKDNVVFSGFYPHADTGAVVNTSSGKFLSIIVPCEPNTSYTWSFDRIVADLRNRVAGYSAYPTVGMACTFLDRETDSPSGSTRTVQKFTTTANTHWLILMVTGTGQTAETLTEDVAENAQLEIGTEMTSYEPYGYELPISSAEQTNNIYLGNVQTTRYVKKLVLTGEENWIYDSNGSQCYINITDAYAKDNRRTQCYCSHYICVYNGEPFNTIPNHSIYINLYNNAARFYIKNEEFTSAADFKSFLAQQYTNGTPVTVWYVLATPETAVVNEPLRKIGDYADTVSYEQAQVSIPTLNGQTVVDVDTTLKPSEAYIKYKE